MPDFERLLEDDTDGEEDETRVGREAEEAEGREPPDDGEEAGEDDADDEGEDEQEEAERIRADVSGGSNRRANRIRNLNRRLQESNRRNEELERRMNALEQSRREAPQPQQRQETQEEEQARMALMSPEERMQYTLDKGMRTMNSMMQRTQVEQMDASDKADFMSFAATDKLAKRFAPKVEELFQNLKSNGRMTARSVILRYLVGEAAIKAGNSRPAKEKRRQAEREINRNRGNGSSPRSDVSSERRRGGQTLEQRLEGKLI